MNKLCIGLLVTQLTLLTLMFKVYVLTFPLLFLSIGITIGSLVKLNQEYTQRK